MGQFYPAPPAHRLLFFSFFPPTHPPPACPSRITDLPLSARNVRADKTKCEMGSTTDAKNLEILDPRGDLTLLVGEDGAGFQVCSRTLARSSHFWAVLLYGQFSEGKAQQTGHGWQSSLPEDDPEALRVLLLAIHGKFQEMPKSLTLNELANLTVAADKYDMTCSLRPFWPGWLESPTVDINEAAVMEIVGYLRTCYTVGYGRGFQHGFECLAKYARADGEGLLRIQCGGTTAHDLSANDFFWGSSVFGEYIYP